MAAEAQTRISVLQGEKVVPLLPASRKPARPLQPWRHTILERHTVGAIEIPEHQHHDLCLHLQLSGRPDLEWWSEGQNRVEQTAPGSMILLAPGTRDRLHWGDTSERLLLSLRPELLQRVAEELGLKAPYASPDIRNRWSLQDASLANALHEMAAETDQGFPLGNLYADLLETGLTSLLLRRYADAAVSVGPTKGRLPMPKLRKALEFMTDNLHRDLRLEEIAHEVGLSPFHFAREFRASSGQTPYQYLLDQRITQAKALLRNSAWEVQEIALQTGFSSPTNFVRVFRKRIGITPGEWRNAQ